MTTIVNGFMEILPVPMIGSPDVTTSSIVLDKDLTVARGICTNAGMNTNVVLSLISDVNNANTTPVTVLTVKNNTNVDINAIISDGGIIQKGGLGPILNGVTVTFEVNPSTNVTAGATITFTSTSPPSCGGGLTFS